METLSIKKSIAINAPKEKVWDVLLKDEYNRIWYAEFSPGTYAETDWQAGSKVVFADPGGSGMIGKIIENTPCETLIIEYAGILSNSQEDYDSEMANAVKGGRENYYLSQKNDETCLSIESDMIEEYLDTMSAAWERALQKIKQLAEN